MVTVLSSKRRQPAGGKPRDGRWTEVFKRWWRWSRLFTLTNITALTVLVTGQPSVGCVVAPDHPSVVIDDCIQVIDRRLLQLILHADTEPAQVQVPKIKPPQQAEATERDAPNASVYRIGKSTMSLILSLQMKLLKEKRLSWMMSTFGRRHSSSCLEASLCCWHLGQYLRMRETATINRDPSLDQRRSRAGVGQQKPWFKDTHLDCRLHSLYRWVTKNPNSFRVELFQADNKEAYHASSGAKTSGFVKRLRHCSRVKCPALAVSLRELGSSS